MIKYANIVASITTIRKNAQNVLDIGSRDGNDAEKLRKLFNIAPNKVYLVEANPDQIPKIKESYPEATVFDFAVSNQTGTAFFNKIKPDNDKFLVGTSSLMERPEHYKNKADKVEVRIQTGTHLLEQIPDETIDLCKIDVEGHTFEVLEGFGDQIQRINTFHIESEHFVTWEKQKLYDVTKAYLESMGYTQIMFMYVWGSIVQSDSVWAKNSILKGPS